MAPLLAKLIELIVRSHFQPGAKTVKNALICLAMSLTLLLASSQETVATLMPYPATIDALAKSSDLVAKVRVLSIDAGQVDNTPLANHFWKVRRARFKIITLVKGSLENSKPELLYRSSEVSDKTLKMWVNVGPENYP